MRRNPPTLGAALVVLGFAGCGGSSSQTARVTTVFAKPPPERSFPSVVAKVRSGVIQIETTTCSGQDIGTGLLLAPRLVATVEHVVDGATSITLKQNGTVVGHGTVIGSDSARDVALVRSDRPISGYDFEFASRSPRLGEDVAAIGFPLALPLTVTRGSVSGLDRTIPINGIERTKLVQTDAAVNPGNSGGPLMSDAGSVVGIVDLGTDQANGLAFAVSAEVAKPLIEAWRASPQAISAATCGNGSSGQQAAPAPPAQTAGPSGSLMTFTGQYFSIVYPDSWTVAAAEVSKGTYLDTTIVNPDDPTILIRVDVAPGANSPDPITESAKVVAQLRSERGYQQIDFSRFNFAGYDALHWEFVVLESGVLLHKEEIVFTSANGDDFAVLVQAPDSDYSSWSPLFTQVFNSLTINH